MALCSACGTEMTDNAVFCPKCDKAAEQPSAGETPSAPPPPPADSHGTTAARAPGLAENVAGMLAYITPIPATIFLLTERYNRNRFVRFHSVQCLFTCAALSVLQILVELPFFSHITPALMFWVYGLLRLAELALLILLVIKAYQHEMFKLPIVGDLAVKACQNEIFKPPIEGDLPEKKEIDLSAVSAMLAKIGAPLFFVPLIWRVLARGFAVGFDFGNMSMAMALGEILGLIALVCGVIAFFQKNGQKDRAMVGMVIGGFVGLFPFIFLLFVALLAK